MMVSRFDAHAVDSQGGTTISRKAEETSHMESNDIELKQWRAL